MNSIKPTLLLLCLSICASAQILQQAMVNSSPPSGSAPAATPTFSPGAGTYGTTQSVTISTATAGATICYTTDGTTPTALTAGTCTHGTTYSAAVSVASSLTLDAIATKSALTNSSVGSAAYVITSGPLILTHAYGGSGSSTTSTAPASGGIDGTGATLITVGLSYVGSPCTISDTSGNVYTQAFAVSSGVSTSAAVYYVRNPTTTTSMSFTCAASYPMINVIVWGQTATSGGPDVKHGNGSGGSTSENAGPITPNFNNEACVAQLTTDAVEGSTPTISSPFTIEDAVLWNTSVGGTSAYQIQATAAAENPTYSWANNISNAAVVACFE